MKIVPNSCTAGDSFDWDFIDSLAPRKDVNYRHRIEARVTSRLSDPHIKPPRRTTSRIIIPTHASLCEYEKPARHESPTLQTRKPSVTAVQGVDILKSDLTPNATLRTNAPDNTDAGEINKQ